VVIGLVIAGAAIIGGGSFFAGRFLGDQKPSDLWLIAALGMGIILGGFISKG